MESTEWCGPSSVTRACLALSMANARARIAPGLACSTGEQAKIKKFVDDSNGLMTLAV